MRNYCVTFSLGIPDLILKNLIISVLYILTRHSLLHPSALNIHALFKALLNCHVIVYSFTTPTPNGYHYYNNYHVSELVPELHCGLQASYRLRTVFLANTLTFGKRF